MAEVGHPFRYHSGVVNTKKEILARAIELVRNAIILAPDLPSHALAAQVIEEADHELLSPLGTGLVQTFFVRLIYQERARIARQAQLKLPGFEELPLRISTPEGGRPLLERSRITQVRGYLVVLKKRHHERLRNDPKIALVEALIKRMLKYTRKHPGITVGEIVKLEVENRDFTQGGFTGNQ